MIDKGVLTVAQNSDTDYIRLAYLQRQSLLKTNPGLPYAIVTDTVTNQDMSDNVRSFFDQVVVLSDDLALDQTWKQRNESQLFWITPFRETIKVEADLIFTGTINHWWNGLRVRDVVISQGCVDFRGKTATSRTYRKLFDANQLPDLYTGLMYWRRSKTAQQFFSTVRNIHDNWDEVKQCLIRVGKDDPGSNDVVFSLAAKIVGEEKVTAPIPYFRMAHFKPSINGLNESFPWHQQLMHDYDDMNLIVAGQRQTYPVHYHDKGWIDVLA